MELTDELVFVLGGIVLVVLVILIFTVGPKVPPLPDHRNKDWMM